MGYLSWTKKIVLIRKRFPFALKKWEIRFICCFLYTTLSLFCFLEISDSYRINDREVWNWFSYGESYFEVVEYNYLNFRHMAKKKPRVTCIHILGIRNSSIMYWSILICMCNLMLGMRNKIFYYMYQITSIQIEIPSDFYYILHINVIATRHTRVFYVHCTIIYFKLWMKDNVQV